jgi:CheY-like chemotaxis protein
LTNLVVNALVHGAGLVEVALDRHGGEIVLDVMDRGDGVPSAMLGRLFMPFERLGNGKDQKSSTGLGLALSRQLARGMGGDLEYLPREGGGAVFRLRLPATDIEPETDVAISSPDPVDVRSGKRVLVVDDHPELLSLCVTYFETMGWSATGAGSAEEALAILGASIFDALLTDLGLPGMDGFELVVEARKLPSNNRMAIAVLTGAALPEAEARCREVGGDFLRAKPVLLSELVGRLALAIDHRRATASNFVSREQVFGDDVPS